MIGIIRLLKEIGRTCAKISTVCLWVNFFSGSYEHIFYVFSNKILNNVHREENAQEIRLNDKMIVKVLES